MFIRIHLSVRKVEIEAKADCGLETVSTLSLIDRMLPGTHWEA